MREGVMSNSSWIGQLNVHQYVLDTMNRELAAYQVGSSKKIQVLTDSQTALTTKISNYGSLQGLMTTFKSNLTLLTSAFQGSYQVSSSNSSVVTAQIIQGSNSGVTVGAHALTVQQLAQAQSIASGAQTSSSSALGKTNTLNFSVGSNSFNLNVSATDNLTTIANNINVGAQANQVGITASVISTGSGSYQLMISGNSTGFDNRFTVSETGTGGDALNIAYTPSGTPGSDGTGTATQLTKAVNALFTFDGLSFNQNTNSNISIGGLSLNLSSVSQQNPDLSYVPSYITVSATSPVSSVASAMQSLIGTYNQIDLLIEKAQMSSGTQDSTLAMVLGSLQAAMRSSVGSGTYKTLASLGITANNTPTPITITTTGSDGKSKTLTYTPMGQLTVDAKALTSVLNTNFSDVQKIMTDSNAGINTQITNMLVVNGSSDHSGFLAKALTDSTTKVNGQISDIDDKLTDEDQKVTDLKAALVKKYAVLEISLQQMQSTSLYLSQQMAMMSKSS
jgi:flagellar hook-associated protein 2